MIPKSGYRFSEKIMRKAKRQSGMTIRRNVITLYANSESMSSCEA